MSDPSGFLTNPPSTVVKVQNTARADMNGQLGIAVAYQQDRGRYLVHNVTTQQTIALKPDNLVKANMMESMKGQYLQIRNDPRVQQQVREYYEKVKRALHPVKPEFAAIGLLVAWCILLYMVGLTRTIMVTSVILLLGVLVAPDLMEGASFQTMLHNFPRRCRESMEETVPMLKGRLSNKVAAGIVLLMVVMAGQAVFTSGTKKPAPTTTMDARQSQFLQKLKEEHYKLGFDDAKNGLDFGTSLKREESSTPRGLSEQEDEYPPMEFDDYGMPPPPQPKRSFGFGTAMSAFFLFRTATELGRDPAGGGFSFQRMVASARVLEPWKMGMVAFSLYNLVRALF